jgi:nucleotide-binding universal stress UspA family protein
MPLLEKADRILVLSVEEGEDTSDAGLSARRLAERLRHYGWPVEANVLRDAHRFTADLLLAAAHEQGAGCLVTGAYSHSHAHELVFGGVTREVLGSCDLPVLFCH